jgi:predicted phosphodiesterase
MRLGVFSDVHSNLEALHTVLTYLSKQKVGQYLFIGDLVGYGANPNECVELIKELKCISIAGNHDYGVIGKTEISNFNDAAISAVLWTKKEVNKVTKDFLKELPLTNKFKNFFLVHSTPKQPELWRYIFTLIQAQDEFADFEEKICFIGHSHSPSIIEKNDKKNKCILINESKIKVKGSGYRYLINVGSVGQPRDNDRRACVVIFDTETNIIEIKRLEYNLEQTQAKILNAGLPPILAYRLAEGK